VRKAEATVRETEDRYRRLIEGAHEYALHTLDEAGRVAGWNVGAQRLFGWASDEIQGRDFGLSFTPEDRADGVPERMLRLAVDEGRFQHEGTRVRKDGTRFWAEVLYTALRDPAGKLLEVSQLTRDTSERQRLEALRKKSTDLEIANRQVVEVARRSANLVGAVAEAIEGPLATIEAEAARLANSDQQRVRPLKDGVAALREAVRNLDALAAGEDHRSGVNPETVDLARIALETRDLLLATAAERRVRVEADVDASLSGVDADPVRLRQVVYNLLSNGIKFSRERGRVSMRMLPEGDGHFRIEVEDSGIGLSADEIGALLRGPEDGAGEEAEGDEGAGLGLAATRRIVEQQGGRLGVHSTPGRGSVFFAVLPRSLGRARADIAAQAEPAGARRVLALSEDSSTRAGISWTLGSAGFDVTAAVTAEEALDISRETRFDIVIVDLRLEGTGATEFVTMLRAEGASRDAPCIVVALGSREYGVAGLSAADVLPRPVPADRLFAALERARGPRGRDSRVWVVDGDLTVCKATARTLDLLGYQAVPEPDANAALKAVAEAMPAALLLAPFPIGMDVFAFLHHFRQFPSAEKIPVLLMLPREFDLPQLESLEEVAAHAAKDGQWHRGLMLAGVTRY
jgi:PAS domain S-box-containing protein